RLHSGRNAVHINYQSFFFFQAEDGIRDKLVTGVQTCALPIWRCFVFANDKQDRSRYRSRGEWGERPVDPNTSENSAGHWPRPHRSEERRVGKECRSRGVRCDLREEDGKEVGWVGQ